MHFSKYALKKKSEIYVSLNTLFGIRRGMSCQGSVKSLKYESEKDIHMYFYIKKLPGLTPLKGIGLRKEDYPNSMAEAGPICKKAEDLISILKIIIGEKASLLNLDAEVDIRCLNIFYQESSGDIRTSSVNWEMRTALLKAVQHFKEITGSATKIEIPDSEYSYRLWRFWITQENFDIKLSITNGKESDKSQTIFEMTIKILKYFLKCLFIQFHIIFDFLVDFIFGLYYDSKIQKVPPVKNNLLLMSASELAEKIRSRKLSSVEVVTAFIERAKEVNEIINAVVEDRYSDALEEAKEVDKFLQTLENSDLIKEKKPLLGVPFTTKESNEAKGMLHTMGLVSRCTFRSEEDATTIRFVKNAGGILIAKTNVPELNLWTESRNNVYGQTCNPYNTTRNVGGSSGGEGAIISACGSAFSIASDIGGSTRMPAFFNGVFGFKPTAGLTPLKGIGLRKEDYPNSMAEAGPICKKAEDLISILKIIIGEKASLLNLDAEVDIRCLNIFYQESSGDIRTSSVNWEMRTALLKAVQHFKEITGSATKIKIPGSEYSYRLWRFWMTQENFDFKLSITNGKYRASALTELSKFLTGKSELTLAAIIKLIDEDIFPREDAEWAKNITTNMKKYLMEKLEHNGILFYPSSPFQTGYHYTAYLRPFNFGYWCLFNVLKFPVCQVPLGVDKNGLPIGVQVVAAPYNDHLCVTVARELEKIFGGWIPLA